MIEIDGSFGEGGGQILRTSLALSMVTGKPFRITDIRSKRPKPGLLRQHLTAVNAAKAICGAEVDGTEISAKTLTFSPGKVKPGEYQFSIGTAGSTTLVLQTILPPLLCAEKPSFIHLEGGTHNHGAPPFHFLKDSFLSAINRMGAKCEAQLERWGFYPAGGGKFSIRIDPPKDGLKPLFLEERGDLVQTEILAVVSKIPREIAADEADLITRGVRFPVDQARIEDIQSSGPGNIAMLKMTFENGMAFFSGFGKIGVSRNKVAHEVSKGANELFRYGAAMDGHLADQMLIPLALAKGGNLSTTEVTGHTETNIEIIRKFLDVSITCHKVKNYFWKLEVLGE